MSQLKIKNLNKKRKEREPICNFKKACLEQLRVSRDEVKRKDDDIIEELIEKEELKKNGSYNHIANIARDLGWTMGRITKSMERLAGYERIQNRIKKQIKDAMEQAEIKEKEDEENKIDTDKNIED